MNVCVFRAKSWNRFSHSFFSGLPKLCEGISVGHKRIEKCDPREVAAVRLRVTKSVARPMIRRLAAYHVG